MYNQPPSNNQPSSTNQENRPSGLKYYIYTLWLLGLQELVFPHAYRDNSIEPSYADWNMRQLLMAMPKTDYRVNIQLQLDPRRATPEQQHWSELLKDDPKRDESL